MRDIMAGRVTAAPTLLVAAAALLSFAANAARGQAADGCWIRGSASDAKERPSPIDSPSVALDGETIKVCYSRPSRHGRAIMGQLVPYGAAWRLGANEATTVHVPFAARIAGVNVAPGWYSLYAVPEANRWRIVVNVAGRRGGTRMDPAGGAEGVAPG